MANLIGETEIRDVRLTGVTAEVDAIPAEMAVQFNAGRVAVQQNPDDLVAQFEHSADFTSPTGEHVATISLVHTAQFSYNEGLTLDDDSVERWVFDNVYFMVYPYVRQALQDTCLRLGLPAVVLGYLKRGETTPDSISLLINTTSLVQMRGEEEPLPVEGEL